GAQQGLHLRSDAGVWGDPRSAATKSPNSEARSAGSLEVRELDLEVVLPVRNLSAQKPRELSRHGWAERARRRQRVERNLVAGADAKAQRTGGDDDDARSSALRSVVDQPIDDAFELGCILAHQGSLALEHAVIAMRELDEHHVRGKLRGLGLVTPRSQT